MSGGNGSTDPAAALLDVRGLSVRFPTPRGLVHAVDDVSFTLETGETLGIVGESGSGKSVLARSIMRLTPSTAMTSGSVTFLGRDLGALAPRAARSVWGRDVAMVFQNPMTSLNPVMTIGRQLAEPLRLHLRSSKREARSRSVELLRSVGVPEPERRLDAYPQELSGGMRQRVSIAMAIACSPQLLLADEPTTALDVTIQRQILDLLSDLQRETHMAMVLITHDLGVVAGRARRVMVMYGGRVVETGPTDSIFEDQRHPYTACLLAAVPRIEAPSHTRLAVIPGRPVDVVDPSPGCRFASRCPRAQPQCRHEDPPLRPVPERPEHSYACFFPVGSAEDRLALERHAVGDQARGG